VDDAMQATPSEGVAGPTQFGEMVPVTVGVLIWLTILAKEGWDVGLHTAWILLIVVPLAAWTLLMRLRYTQTRFQRTVGPWRNEVDLTSLQSIKWKMTGGWRGKGMIFVRDEHGGRVGIYVGRFNRVGEWGPLLLRSAERSGATVDRHSRSILQGHLPE